MKVSIIVPVYNTQAYIERCLNSLLSQSMNNIEIIVVDDCGSDGAMDIAKSYARVDSRIKIVNNMRNYGLLHARIIGAKYAQGEYVLYVDSDDYIYPQTCQIAYQKAREYDADIVAFGSLCEGFYRSTFYTHKERIYADSYKLLFPNTHSFTPYVWNKLYKRELIERVDTLLKTMPFFTLAEDVVKSFVALGMCKRAVGIPYRFYVYCANEKSSTASIKKDEYIQAYQNCLKGLKRCLEDMEDSCRIHKAYRHLMRILEYLILQTKAKSSSYLWHMCLSLGVWFRLETLVKIVLYICSGGKIMR